MAEAVDLDSRGYRGAYKLIGGRPSLDFANLVSYRDTDRAHDWLDPADNLQRWVRAAQLDARLCERADALVDLREDLARVFLAVVDGRDPSGAALDHIASVAQRARARQRLVWSPADESVRWALPQPCVNELLALDAVELITDDSLRGRLGACGECRWVYLDTTRNRSRRWCDPADCGNRARQRRHYHGL